MEAPQDLDIRIVAGPHRDLDVYELPWLQGRCVGRYGGDARDAGAAGDEREGVLVASRISAREDLVGVLDDYGVEGFDDDGSGGWRGSRERCESGR